MYRICKLNFNLIFGFINDEWRGICDWINNIVNGVLSGIFKIVSMLILLVIYYCLEIYIDIIN